MSAGAGVAADGELVDGVRSARDVMQFALTGVGPARGAVAQVLWSRSRGLVLNASRLPAPEPGSAYQVWLLGDPAPANVAMFSPDASGRATVAAGNPQNLPYPVHNVTVTIESVGGAAPAPSGATALTRVVR